MRHRYHRQLGLPNANQILLCLTVCGLFFFSLLRRNWLQFNDDPPIHASLKRVYIENNNELTASESWEEFCADDSFQMTIPGTNRTTQVVTIQDGSILCRESANGSLVPEVMVWILASGLSCALGSTLLAVYLQLGNPTKEMIFWIGTIPSISLFASAILGTASLLVWQRHYVRFDNGDCFNITIAATVIAYAAAISMAIRWRWPGICAVPNEQQVLGSRLYGVQLPPRGGQRRGSTGVPATANGTPFESLAAPLHR